MSASKITIEQSNAFVETCDVPPTGAGPLDGLRFAVKDLIDVAGTKTGCGNPSWRDGHPPAVVHAVCVEQLLRAGGHCVGKSITDEMAFSLIGENHFHGTPLNPRAPDRVPGGSSSGSASAVACGLVDFALGTDTGGSVRVPANNCGVWGLRPSHGFISVAGVNPFAPGFDTVGVLASTADILRRAANVLLGNQTTTTEEPDTIYFLRDAFDLADADVRQALTTPIKQLRDRYGKRVRDISLEEIVTREPSSADADTTFRPWFDAYCVLQWAEIRSCLGAWIEDAKPEFGPIIEGSFNLTTQLDRRRIAEAVDRRERYYRCLRSVLGPRDLLCMPTSPTLPPLKGAMLQRSQAAGDYYPRALSLTSVAGLGRLPQVSMPLSESAGVPVGLSLLGGHGCDAFLLDVIQDFA